MSRWWTFIIERFPPGSYLPLVAVFVVANLAIAGASPTQAGLALFIAPVVVLSYFLRLRCFDEIKDLEVDRRINPTRPLARGLIAVPEVKRVLAALTVLELVLVGVLGLGPLLGHALAVLFSFGMYNEFFLGRYLRPHLTLYAVTHTASSALLGWSVASMVLGVLPWELPAPVLLFAFANWSLFNVFEFARKTYAPSEEREAVETYSLNFGPWGAALLTLSQVAIAWSVVSVVGPQQPAYRAWLGATSVLFAVLAVAYASRATVALAKSFRAGAGLYLVSVLAALAVHAVWR